MSAIQWNGHFELGLNEIDAQHQRLVTLINGLSLALSDARPLPEVDAMLDRLEAYADEHFQLEEAIMASSTLPAAAQQRHCAEHSAFLGRIAEIRRCQVEQPVFAAEMLDFLNTWFVAHILETDRQLVGAMASEAGPAATEAAEPFAVPRAVRVLIDALTESESRFRLISDHAPTLMWVSDPAGHIGYHNRAWFDLVGGAGREPFDHITLIAVDDRDAYADYVADLLRRHAAGEREYRVIAGGAEVWLLERVRPRLDARGHFAGLVAAASDVTAIKRTEARLADVNRSLEAEVARRTAELEALSLTDPLTGIGNRRRLGAGLREELRRAQRYGRPLSVVFLDIDHFKLINDSFGHRAGDAVLAAVAAELRGVVRDVDVLGRWGGEEFVALLPETGLREAAGIAERLRAAVAAVRAAEMPGRTISASVGVAEWQAGESGESLMRRADRALYVAKAAGRNRVTLATMS